VKSQGTDRLLDHFFRHQYGAVLASLTRMLGPQHFDLAEEAVQEAQLRALRSWPLRGQPDKPGAWLLRTARNHAIDVLRRVQRQQQGVPELSRDDDLASLLDNQLDDQLRMIFGCCQPALSRPDRVALTLQVVGGFHAREIARAFLRPEPALAQRLVRAKRRLREAEVSFELPGDEGLAERLDPVLDVLYLMFNEGYTCHDGDSLLRREIADEAIRLTTMLLDHPVGQQPHVHALLALMLFQSSRLGARLTDDGRLLPLEQQDRTRWEQPRIIRGLQQLKQAASGEALTEYHLLAGIAAAHATASSYGETDWPRILTMYDELVARNRSFILALNRTVALSMVEGPQAALNLLERLDRENPTEGDYLFEAARADFLRRLDRQAEAREAYRHAATLAPTAPERRYLEARAD